MLITDYIESLEDEGVTVTKARCPTRLKKASSVKCRSKKERRGEKDETSTREVTVVGTKQLEGEAWELYNGTTLVARCLGLTFPTL